MINPSEIRENLSRRLSEFVAGLSGGFVELSHVIKDTGAESKAQQKLDWLFNRVMEFNRNSAGEINSFINLIEELNARILKLEEEKNRFEILYSSGIAFSTETETRQLAGRAIDVVVKELHADAGFIVLTDEDGQIESIYAKNMDPDSNPDARELSTTVINNTISQLKPLQINDPNQEKELARHTSIIRLNLSAVICVPLISGDKVFGAVYLDRREKENPFSESDLRFLISFANQIVKGVEIAREFTKLENEVIAGRRLRFCDLREAFKCEEIIGSSQKLFDVLLLASKVSSSDASVLLLGENGTGKDLVARAIHNNSSRANGPFISINCGAIPGDLLESELFGYESGAFTGANRSKPGRFEMADGGTLFLDEIGELNVNLQAKLLRVIQTREIERLGSVQSRKINVRIIAATNKLLSEMVNKGIFREDLYYRLKVIEIKMPPLRERKEDIEEMVGHFLVKYSSGTGPYQISPEALSVLEEYNWPGNVRELENVVQRGIVLSRGSRIEVEDLPPELVDMKSAEPFIKPGKTLQEAETDFRRRYVLKTLRTAGSKSEAAKILGVNRTHFYKLLAQLGIEE